MEHDGRRDKAAKRSGPENEPHLDSDSRTGFEAAPALESLTTSGSESLVGSSPATKDSVDASESDGGFEGGEGPDRELWSEFSRVSLDDLDELTIVARAQDGDPQAFEWLISAYQGGVYRLCVRMLNDRAEAEDVVQETFISAWRTLPNLTAPQSFIPWLYRTATNKCLDHLRKRKRRPAEPTANEDLDGTSPSKSRDTIGAGPAPDPAQEFEHQAQMRALADLLPTVPPGPRACWLLREVHEFSYSEIAAIMQLPESTVRGRIARAKRSLAEGMEPWR